MSENLSPAKIRLLEAMLQGRNIPQAARHLGMVERTARRWADDPLFQHELRTRSTDLLAASGRALASASSSAAAVAWSIANDATMPPGVRLAAARLILEKRTGLVEELDILPRLEALEARQNGNK